MANETPDPFVPFNEMPSPADPPHSPPPPPPPVPVDDIDMDDPDDLLSRIDDREKRELMIREERDRAILERDREAAARREAESLAATFRAQRDEVVAQYRRIAARIRGG